MKLLFKRILKNLHRYILWAVIASVFTAWIFFLVTDVKPAKKITLLADVDGFVSAPLKEELSKEMPSGIRTIVVEPFSYIFLSGNMTGEADILIIPGFRIPEFADGLRTLEERPGADDAVYEGRVVGRIVYNASSGEGSALSFIGYPDNGENYYLCFSASSVHYSSEEKGPDEALASVAERLLALP